MNIYKKLRKEKGLTQTQLAEKLNLTQTTVGKWENEKSTPDYDTLKALSKLYDVSIDYLLGNDELVPMEKAQQQVLTVEQARDVWLDSLDPDDKTTILMFLNLSFKDRYKVQGYIMNMTQQMV